jgi:hypothetical protein
MANHLEGSERQKSRTYSPAVVTEGGRALITVTNFARPGMEIEIQGIAVIGDRA